MNFRSTFPGCPFPWFILVFFATSSLSKSLLQSTLLFYEVSFLNSRHLLFIVVLVDFHEKFRWFSIKITQNWGFLTVICVCSKSFWFLTAFLQANCGQLCLHTSDLFQQKPVNLFWTLFYLFQGFIYLLKGWYCFIGSSFYWKFICIYRSSNLHKVQSFG